MPLSRTLLPLTVGIALAAALVPAQTSLMPLSEVQPGMRGIGRTVFGGSTREEFTVDILGVLENVLGPRRSLILARLDGGPLGETGVIAGMSGSPVYIDGRLVGAVSYSLGAFSKAPIAGLTPIEEMMEVFDLPATRAATRVDLMPGASPIELQAALRSLARGLTEASGSPATIPEAMTRQAGLRLLPIVTPIGARGLSPSTMPWLADLLGTAGIVPLASASASGEADDEPLQPGDAVGVSLVRGDFELGATGTVTHVDGERVYAFGHPFLNLGPTAFPMTRAQVYTLLPSLMSSSKIAGLGSSIGTIQQDRTTAIAGTLGETPSLVPMTLRLESDRGQKRTFTYEIVRDQTLTPILSYVALLSTLQSYERQSGGATLEVSGTLSVQGHGDVTFADVFTGDAPSGGAAAYVATPITLLLLNEFEAVELTSIDLTIRASEEPRWASIERVWLDAVDITAGRTVPLKVLTRSYRGDEELHTIPIDIPSNVVGLLSILVSDGTRLTQVERQERRIGSPPTSVAQMLRTLNEQRRNNRLYVRLSRADSGAVVRGEALSSLPASILSVLEGDRGGSDLTPLTQATLREWDVPTAHAIRGSRLLTIDVEPQ